MQENKFNLGDNLLKLLCGLTFFALNTIFYTKFNMRLKKTAIWKQK